MEKHQVEKIMTRHFTARRLAVSLMAALLAIGATAPAFALEQDKHEDRDGRKQRKQQVDREESSREQPQRQEPQRQERQPPQVQERQADQPRPALMPNRL